MLDIAKPEMDGWQVLERIREVSSVPDEQIGRIVGAIVLPDVWMDRVLAKIHVADEVEKVQKERGLVGSDTPADAFRFLAARRL